MILRLFLLLVLLSSPSLDAKKVDPYKVLGVERDANQRQIQKAFHKLSLQYHPDKNKNKGAQEKFAEINNAYEILSDEQKRKNYDLYGDETGNPGFGSGHPGGHGGHTHFRSGNHGDSRFTYRPDEWQRTGGQGYSKSYSFSFGNPSPSGNSFNFGFDDMFSNLFGGSANSWNPFGSSTGSQSGSRASPHRIQPINSLTLKKDIVDKGITWVLLSYTPMSKEYHVFESVVEEVGRSLEGALKVGSINCQDEKSLCKELSISPTNKARLFVYSYKAGDKGSLVEYTGLLEAKSLKSFCQDHLPSFSRRVNLGSFDFSSSTKDLPLVLLLSTKKNTPVIWRVLSGLYRKRIIFYDAEVTGVSDPTVKRLGVDALPAVVGWQSNGEKLVIKTGITVKNMKSVVDELSVLLDNFEKKNKKATTTKGRDSQEDESEGKHVPLLVSSNLETICGDRTPVCIIGVFRSSKGREKLESILSNICQKSLTRQKNNSGVSVSYSLLDATKQMPFLNSFDKSGFKSNDKLLLAYKPRKGKFAAFTNEVTMEEVEKFVGSVLNGDVKFSKVRQKPTLK